MPADIRSFFGGTPAATPPDTAKKPPPKKARASRKVVEDSDDEPEEPKPKTTTKKAQTKKAPPPPPPDEEETTTAAYFASKSKPKRSEPVKPKEAAAAAAAATPARPAARTAKKAAPSYAEDVDEDDFDDHVDLHDRVSAPPPKRAKKEDDDAPAPRSRSAAKVKQSTPAGEDDHDPRDDVVMKDTKPDDDDFVEPDGDDMAVEDLPAPKQTAAKPKPKAGAKRKSKDLEDEDDDLPDAPKPKRARAAPKKAAKKEDAQDSTRVQAILADIPLITPPSPPKDAEKKKFQYGQQAANQGPAPEAGGVDIPEGNENCLAGMTFVFTGQLRYIAREEGQNLVKRYGAKVTTAPSKNTTWVVLGSDAGPKKLETIAKFGIKTIDETGLFKLIEHMPANGGDGEAAAKQAEKQQKEQQKIREMAAEMEKQERQERRAGGAGGGKAAVGATSAAAAAAKGVPPGPDNRLWTVKYAPQSMAQICGNKGQVEKLQAWLRAFPKNQRTKFKLPGKDGSGIYRAVMIHGPPGIGKTTAAHLVAKLEGYDVVESNASDTRSKKLVESGLKGVLSTTSLMGYFAGDGQKVEEDKKKLVLIMDEVDGMSAGDRGGVGALAAVCKKSQIPMILICNDRKLPKMKPFDFVTFDLPFRRPTADMIRSRIATVAHREGLRMPPNVINALIEGTGADIRQVINMISTAKLDQTAMDYGQGKDMSKAWEKHVVLKPWDITSKILGGGMFQPSSKATLNDKIELYFNDHDFSPLMLAENYLGTNPILSQNSGDAKQTNLKKLELASKAAESISDGDLVDRMIHGSQQQWSLMPAHAVFSFVRPASFVAGSMAGNQTRFAAWLGKNSSQGKLMRMVKELQGHMRLRTSGDRHEIRQQYMPILWQSLINKMQTDGKDAVPDVIELMDNYFLTRDDFDAILELGVGPMDQEKVNIPTQTKAAFTRTYNNQSHPLPFMKASAIAPANAKKLPREKPDLEEAMDDSEDEVVAKDEAEVEEADEDMDISKDKYVAKPKKKKAAPKATAAKAKGKKKVVEEESDEDEEEDEDEVKPKKRAPAKGRAKK